MEIELPEDVLAAVHAGRKIDAIKLLRGHRGIGLKEAKQVIEIYIAQNPELITAKPSREGVGLARIVLPAAIALLCYGLYDYFVGVK
ncbi:MAG: hypothetical protein KUG71_04850 [Porticoccaceae bacterium]|nr:hypothetical protein [Porticoccaceae bacterium]